MASEVWSRDLEKITLIWGQRCTNTTYKTWKSRPMKNNLLWDSFKEQNRQYMGEDAGKDILNRPESFLTTEAE